MCVYYVTRVIFPEQAIPSVHSTGVSGAEEAAGLAPASTHHLFVTNPAHAQYSDDITFSRQRSMPETHALSIVCGSTHHHTNDNSNNNNTRLRPDQHLTARRKSVDSGRFSPSQQATYTTNTDLLPNVKKTKHTVGATKQSKRSSELSES